MSLCVVHGIPGSPCVRSVLLGLEEKGAGWRLAPLSPGEHKGEAHRRRHPFGRMPVLDHDGFMLYETQAILRYLDRIFPEPPLTPDDTRTRARMDQICGITDWYVFKDISAGIAFPRMVAPVFGITVDEERIASSLPGAMLCVAELARLLGEAAYMTGNSISIADLMLAPHLAFFSDTPEGVSILAPYPNLIAWIARMKTRASMQTTEWSVLIARVQAA